MLIYVAFFPTFFLGSRDSIQLERFLYFDIFTGLFDIILYYRYNRHDQCWLKTGRKLRGEEVSTVQLVKTCSQPTEGFPVQPIHIGIYCRTCLKNLPTHRGLHCTFTTYPKLTHRGLHSTINSHRALLYNMSKTNLNPQRASLYIYNLPKINPQRGPTVQLAQIWSRFREGSTVYKTDSQRAPTVSLYIRCIKPYVPPATLVIPTYLATTRVFSLLTNIFTENLENKVVEISNFRALPVQNAKLASWWKSFKGEEWRKYALPSSRFFVFSIFPAWQRFQHYRKCHHPGLHCNHSRE